MNIEKIKKNYSLESYNTFAINVRAKYFYEINSVSQLQIALPELRRQQLPLLILGGGSNILLTKDFPGIVIKVSLPGITLIDEDANTVSIKVNAGENWHQFVMHCIDQNYGGIENLSLIPGQVGAAPIQNIGAYGVEIKDVFHSLTALELTTNELHIFSHDQCQLGYRDSIFKRELRNKYLITDITLRLNKSPQLNLNYHGLQEMLSIMKVSCPSIKDVSQAVMRIRQQKLPDPKKIGNAGSFFKNPIINHDTFYQLQQQYPQLPGFELDTQHYKLPAAWLIEQCGFKGKRINQIGVHQQQALVLVNHGNGDGRAIAELAAQIQQSVFDKFKVLLETEVNII